MTIEDLKEDYNWEEVFKYSNYKIEDVSEIIASDYGANEGDDWIGIFKMSDGKYSVLNAGCDYTGWDCQASGSETIHDTLERAISKMSLGEDWRERLKDQLTKYELDW